MNIQFEVGSRVVRLRGGHVVELARPVRALHELEGVFVLLLDPDSTPGAPGQFPNIIGLGREGEELWTAELPTTTTGDCYVGFASNAPLAAYSWSGYRVGLDPVSGRIVSREFVK